MPVSPSLPSGWQTIEELAGSPEYETTYRVQRAGMTNGNLNRLVRIVRFRTDETSARMRYVERLAAIAGASIPYLCPVEFWEDSAITVGALEPEHVHTLASGAEHAASKFSATDWDAIVEQLLTALAGLHSLKEQHGAVRPQHIGLIHRPVDGNPPLVALNYFATGTVAWLGLAGTETQQEWQYYSCDPGQQFPRLDADVDLFALGLTLLEATCGRDANPLRVQHPADRPADRTALLTAVQKHLGRTKLSSRAKQLIQKLVTAKTAERFPDAEQALRWWRQQESNRQVWLQRYWGLVVAVLAGFLLVLGLRWSGTTTEISKLTQAVAQREQEIQDTKKKVDELARANSDLKGEKGKLTDKNAELIAQIEMIKNPPGPKTTPVPAPFDEAKEYWTKAISGAKTTEELIKKVQDPLGGEKAPLSEAARDHVKKWGRSLEGFLNDPWNKVDRDFQVELVKFRQMPWNGTTSIVTRTVNLVEAEKVWTGWANNDALTFADLRQQAPTLPPNIIPIVGAWLNDTQNRASWQIQLTRASSTTTWGLERQLYVDAGGSQNGYDAHQWQKWDSFTYAGKTITFTHKPGAPVRLVFEGGRIWSRIGAYCPNLIDKTFLGPLPLWLAHQQGQVGPENGNALEFEIVNCPGPPRKPSLNPPRPLTSTPTVPKGKTSKP